MLDELDRELERRGHRLVRYLDDCNIYVRSEKAGRRVMESLTRFIERRLKLQINAEKSAVARPWDRSFLGFTMRNGPGFPRCLAAKAVVRFKHRVRELTGRHRGIAGEDDRRADPIASQLSAIAAKGEKAMADPISLSKSLEGLRALYLDLMESTLIGAVYEDPPLPIFDWKQFDPNVRNRGFDWPKNAFSMIGAARIRNFRVLIERVISDEVPGDIVETGVWRGGASILARAVLAAYGVRDRRVILADSFKGLPPPDKDQYPADAGSVFHEYSELAVSEDKVQSNFEKFGLFDDQVVLLKGWFKNTMPLVPSDRIAILRLDGDLYESTIIPLMHLFDKVSTGGWIIVDDYECVPACKLAIQDFLSGRGLMPDIRPIDGVGVFFEKTAP